MLCESRSSCDPVLPADFHRGAFRIRIGFSGNDTTIMIRLAGVTLDD